MSSYSSTVVSELEGTLLKDSNPFPYFMLVAFEASGLIRFTALLVMWPAIKVLGWAGLDGLAVGLSAFVATAGVPEAEIEAAARAVLPKFFMDDLDMAAWRRFGRHHRRIVVTEMPRVFVERFAKEHLRADVVVGPEIGVNRRFGFATGFLRCGGDHVVTTALVDAPPHLGMGRTASFLSLCKEQVSPPFTASPEEEDIIRPVPVIFHDGRLVKRPTAAAAVVVLVWIPFGIVLAAIRMAIGLLLPMWAVPSASRLLGGRVIIRGDPPPAPAPGKEGVLFVCTHRTLMDPVVLSSALRRRVPAVTYSISRLSEILSPIPTVRLTRSRSGDARRIKAELSRGDLAVCPEGTTCREPFLLRFSALFAELTDRIVPVAMNYRIGGVFHATTARGWKGLDPIFFLMNPRPVYEVTFLSQLPRHATCSGGQSPHDVANHVQRILAASLGFEPTSLTRRDKYRLLAGNDGIVPSYSHVIITSPLHNFLSALKPFFIKSLS